jgi:hypothetical protein
VRRVETAKVHDERESWKDCGEARLGEEQRSLSNCVLRTRHPAWTERRRMVTCSRADHELATQARIPGGTRPCLVILWPTTEASWAQKSDSRDEKRGFGDDCAVS